MGNLVIAVDGPAGAGKSTIAKIVAKKLNINYIDTGAMYRAVTYKCLKSGIDVNNEKEVIQIAENSDIDFKDNNIYLDKEVINEKIGMKNSVILDGRDIGSYVFPDADYKFFLVATPEERGNRRYKELCNKGYNTTLEEVIEDIIRRDEIDSNREFAPLVKANDALEIDTTGKTIEEVVEEVVSKINL